MHAERRGFALNHAAAVFRQPHLWVAHLAVAGFATELRPDLVDLRDARGSDRVALRDEPAAGVHRFRPVKVSRFGVDQLPAFARRTEPKLLV